MNCHLPKLRNDVRLGISGGRASWAGQALVELALITAVLLILLLGALDLGRVFYSQIAVTDAAKEGALVASQGGTYVANTACNATTNTITCAVVTEAKGGLVEVDPTVAGRVTATTCPTQPDANTPPVTVTVKVPFQAITPIVAAALSGSNGLISAAATTPCRYVPAFVAGNPNPNPPPEARFTVTPTSGTAPLPVTVNDTSIGSPTSWLWDFGDGQTSTLQNPSHTYALDGTWHLTLTVSNANGTSLPVTHDVTVTAAVVVPPVVAFTATPMTGNAPLDVTVKDNSGGTPTSWAWTFGDGQTSNVQNPPVHTYASPGTYPITLTVTNSAGSSGPLTKQIVVTDACATAVIDFTYGQQNKNKPVDFAGTIVPAGCPVTQWAWTFGDGGSATGQTLSHAYPAQGTNYTVVLTVSSPAGTFTKTKTVTTK